MKKENIKKEKNEEESIVGNFLRSTPFFGGFFKELGKTEVFQERFKEVDEKIKENLKKGERKRWGCDADISVRPIFNDVKKEPPEICIHEDYFYEKKENKLTVVVKVPHEDVALKIKGKTLFITSVNFEKQIELRDYYNEVKKKQYKKGLLVLELTK